MRRSRGLLADDDDDRAAPHRSVQSNAVYITLYYILILYIHIYVYVYTVYVQQAFIVVSSPRVSRRTQHSQANPTTTPPHITNVSLEQIVGATTHTRNNFIFFAFRRPLRSLKYLIFLFCLFVFFYFIFYFLSPRYTHVHKLFFFVLVLRGVAIIFVLSAKVSVILRTDNIFTFKCHTHIQTVVICVFIIIQMFWNWN